MLVAMDLSLSRLGDYALRAALDLAEHWDPDGGYRKIREVVAAADLPASYAPHVLGRLAKAGLAEAKAGREGGYRLSRPPERITMLEVIEGVEGGLAPDRCPFAGGPRRWDELCAFHPIWTRLTGALKEQLRQETLDQVVADDRTLERGGSLPGDPHPLPRLRRRPARTRSA
jgi:Rrf2 family protein